MFEFFVTSCQERILDKTVRSFDLILESKNFTKMVVGESAVIVVCYSYFVLNFMVLK